jgi:radical SAM superfamily enzyme YgiQ (UPF0313 family)
MIYDPSDKNLKLDRANIEKLAQLSFEIGAIRPPSEGGSHSLLLRVTRNCPWSRCKFCYAIMYDRAKFQLRSVEDIKQDIDIINEIAEGIKEASWELGYGGRINEYVGTALLQSESSLRINHSFVLVFNWLYFGARTVFLQDANSLIMPTSDLLEVLRYLKETFPTVERVTSYARAKTLAKKTLDELKELRQAGLSRLHVGLETGDDELLKYVDKGVTSQEQIQAGKKAKEAGFELSEYVMPGLGGTERSDQHARNTARVLNEIDPDYIRLRPFVPGPGTPLYEEYSKGGFKLSSPYERLREIKTLVENLNVKSRLCFDHFLNSWYRDSTHRNTLFKQDYEGYKLPEEKTEVLKLIEEGLRIDESIHIHVKDVIGMTL